MSMKEHPASGYLVEASKLKALFPEHLHNTFDTALSDGAEGFEAFMDEYWAAPSMAGVPLYLQIYSPTTEDSPDEETMEEGGIYVLFDEEDLFTKVSTEAMIKLKVAGAEPKFSRWTVWG